MRGKVKYRLSKDSAIAGVFAEAEKRRQLPCRANDFERLKRKLSGLLEGPALAAAVRELAHAIDV
jgi:hypothetical protein